MILTTMLLIIAALVFVVVGFILDRLAIRKIKSGMRKLNARIKTLETSTTYTVEIYDDTKADPETEEAGGGDIPAEADDTIQETGD